MTKIAQIPAFKSNTESLEERQALPGHPSDSRDWSGYEKVLFRFFFLYFILQSVPLDWKYYRALVSIPWTALQYGDIFYLSRYSPRFFTGAETFANWGIIALLALVGAAIWSGSDRNRTHYKALYYWVRVVVRYRLALGVIGYGFIKLFPLQSPLPSLSNLNTHYGDFHAWKLFSMSLGIVPNYESFLGLVEIAAGLLLLYRKTASIGAFIILAFTGNVFVSNLAYEGGEYVYSLYLISLAAFVLAFDVQRLINLLVLERPTVPNRYVPDFALTWQRNGRWVLKGAFVFFFIVFYGYQTYAGYRNGPYHYPQTPGLAQASGIYNVSEFRINNQLRPYSATDPIRWKDVVFEKWTTISIRSNRPVKLEVAQTEEIHAEDKDRIYELSGSAGRHYYAYQIDTLKQVLTLQNRNKNYAQEKLILHYQRPDSSRIILSGINESRDSIHVELTRINKKYLLEEVAREGRRKSLKL
jgi:hypothetical protein